MARSRQGETVARWHPEFDLARWIDDAFAYERSTEDLAGLGIPDRVPAPFWRPGKALRRANVLESLKKAGSNPVSTSPG